jgi:phosphoribosyl-ATP pyrophosphohydrolase
MHLVVQMVHQDLRVKQVLQDLQDHKDLLEQLDLEVLQDHKDLLA